MGGDFRLAGSLVTRLVEKRLEEKCLRWRPSGFPQGCSSRTVQIRLGVE